MLPFLVTVCTITLILVCVLTVGALWFWPLTLHSQLQLVEDALGSLSYLQELARDQLRECHADLMRFPPWSHTPGYCSSACCLSFCCLSPGALWPALLSSLSLLRFVGRRFLAFGGFLWCWLARFALSFFFFPMRLVTAL